MVEEAGTGIDRMIEALDDALLVPPQFEERDASFRADAGRNPEWLAQRQTDFPQSDLFKTGHDVGCGSQPRVMSAASSKNGGWSSVARWKVVTW